MSTVTTASNSPGDGNVLPSPVPILFPGRPPRDLTPSRTEAHLLLAVYAAFALVLTALLLVVDQLWPAVTHLGGAR